jgi:hypothetical protein
MVDVAVWLSTNWEAVVAVISAGIAAFALWLNWRLTGASREHLVNEEFRTGFKELSGEEPKPTTIETILTALEGAGDEEMREMVRRLRNLQKRSRLYRRKA